MLLEVLLSFVVKVKTLLGNMLIFRTELVEIRCLMVAMALSVVHVMPSWLTVNRLWKRFRLRQAWIIWVVVIDEDWVWMVSEMLLVVGYSADACLSNELIWVREYGTCLLVVSLRRKRLLSRSKRLEMWVAIPTKAVIYRSWSFCIPWHALTLILLGR